MKTYQDWLEVAEKSDKERMDFVFAAIVDYKNSDDYKFALTAQSYYNGKNETIEKARNFIYNATGQAIEDDVSANHKIADNFFKRDVVQATSTLLSNGCTWSSEDKIGGKKLGKSFDRKLCKLHRWAQIAGVSWAFFNMDHIDTFKATEFFGLKDEEDGKVKAGIRFWQLNSTKPLRAELYELDGYTGFIRREGKAPEIYAAKRAYKVTINSTVADGEEISGGENYASFPVVPLYANEEHQSELVGLRNTIDAIDLIQSGYCNDTDDMNYLYWTVVGNGGMDDADLIQVLNKLRKIKAANLDNGNELKPHTVDMPYLSREAILDRLEKKLYKDAMALNTYDLASGAVTATQIIAAYEPLSEKLDLHEDQISDFIERLLTVAGVEDEATFNRSLIINQSEMINNYINSAPYLDDEYVTEKIMTVLGDKDQVQTVLDRRAATNIQRLTGGGTTPQGNAGTEVNE